MTNKPEVTHRRSPSLQLRSYVEVTPQAQIGDRCIRDYYTGDHVNGLAGDGQN